MSVSKRVQYIKDTIKSYKDIFEYPEVSLNSVKTSNNSIYFPREVDFDKAEGAELKGGVGFLSVFEDYDETNKKVKGYIYRFSSDEYTYLVEHKKSKECVDTYFNFHYQDDDKHEPHVSFLHNSIRYNSANIQLDEFLDFVKRTFMGPRKGMNYRVWHSRN